MPYSRPRHNPGRSADTRPTSAKRGYGAAHRRWRRLVLSLYPVCTGWPRGTRCLKASVVADHDVPISQGGSRFDILNGRGMCRQHHSAKSQWERETYGIRRW